MSGSRYARTLEAWLQSCNRQRSDLLALFASTLGRADAARPLQRWRMFFMTCAELFNRLKRTGYRVIIGVSGHNVQGQIGMINKALEPVTADGTVAGVGLREITLSRGPESGTDHAAKWETSNMIFIALLPQNVSRIVQLTSRQ